LHCEDIKNVHRNSILRGIKIWFYRVRCYDTQRKTSGKLCRRWSRLWEIMTFLLYSIIIFPRTLQRRPLDLFNLLTRIQRLHPLFTCYY